MHFVIGDRCALGAYLAYASILYGHDPLMVQHFLLHHYDVLNKMLEMIYDLYTPLEVYSRHTVPSCMEATVMPNGHPVALPIYRYVTHNGGVIA